MQNQPQTETTPNRVQQHATSFPKGGDTHKTHTVAIVTIRQNIVQAIEFQSKFRHFFCSGVVR